MRSAIAGVEGKQASSGRVKWLSLSLSLRARSDSPRSSCKPGILPRQCMVFRSVAGREQ